MKRLLFILPFSVAVISCKQNEATGEMEPSWVFWVLLGLIALGLIFGVVSASVRKNRTTGKGKTEEEIEKYQETLENKEKEEGSKSK